MDSDPLPLSWSLILILLLVLWNGFFVAAEFAMVKIKGTRIDQMAGEGSKRAGYARRLVDNLDHYLAVCQLGITLASLGLGWIGAQTIARLINPLLAEFQISDAIVQTVSFVLAFSVIAFMHVLFGQLAPKSVAVRNPEKLTLMAAMPLTILHKIMYPFIWVVNGTANRMLSIFGMKPISENESAHTEDEIRILMKESHKSGHIDNTELTLVDNIFDFAETSAREIMIPRTEMNCLYANLSFEENKRIALKEMHTRYPVCENDKDNIVGFVHIRDLLRATPHPITSLKQIIRPITTVPETMQISQLLKLMQKKKTQIAILIDEYGGTSGLVTLEDIMEEIVGDIQDEFDEERPDMERRSNDTYSINGLLLIEEVNSYFSLDLSSEDYDTIGGWIYSQIDIPPQKHQVIRYEDQFEFIIEETDNKRISRLLVRRLAEEHHGEPLLQESG